MTKDSKRLVTDYWTLLLRVEWKVGDGVRKPAVVYESSDSTQKVIINTLACDEGTTQDPAASIAAFEDSVRSVAKGLLGRTYAIIFSDRAAVMEYELSTLVGFDPNAGMGICSRLYASPHVAIRFQAHHYACESLKAFDLWWRAIADEFAPVTKNA